jgi:hypothetical protein
MSSSGLALELMIPTDKHGSKLDLFSALRDPQKGGETEGFLRMPVKKSFFHSKFLNFILTTATFYFI